MKQFKITESREIVILSKDEILAVAGDKNTAQYQFVMAKVQGGIDLSTYRFAMKTLSTGGEAWADLSKIIEGDNLVLKWQVAVDQLCYAGAISLQIVATQGDNVWQTIEVRARITKSLSGDSVVPAEPSYFLRMIKEINDIADTATSEATKAATSNIKSAQEADRATAQADRAKQEADRASNIDAYTKGDADYLFFKVLQLGVTPESRATPDRIIKSTFASRTTSFDFLSGNRFFIKEGI